MDPLTIGLITGGANLLGSFFSSETSSSNMQAQLQAQQGMQQQSQQFSADQAQINRDFQQQMSSTAYQRASADMQKAGLNPASMFGSGSAASSPSGSAPTSSAPSVPTPQRTSPFAGIGAAVNQAVSSAIQAKTFDKMTQEVSNMQTQQALTAAQKRTEEEKPSLIASETGLKKAQTFNVDTSTAREANKMPSYRLEGVSAQDILDMPDWLRRSMNIGTKGADLISGIAHSAGKVKNVFQERWP